MTLGSYDQSQHEPHQSSNADELQRLATDSTGYLIDPLLGGTFDSFGDRGFYKGFFHAMRMRDLIAGSCSCQRLVLIPT